MRHWFPCTRSELKQIERYETERLLEQAEDFASIRAKRKPNPDEHQIVRKKPLDD